MWAYAWGYLTEHWQVAANFILIAATHNAAAILTQNVVQRRRRSQKPEIVYWTVKMLAQDLFLAIIMGGYMESHRGLYIFYVVLKSVTAVTNFLILYYTYEGGAVRTALYGMASELVSVSVGGIVLFVLYKGKADMQEIIYLCPFTWKSLLFPVLCSVIFFTVYLLFGKQLKKLRDYPIRHRKFWVVFFVTYICITLAQSFLKYRTIIVGVYAVNFLVTGAAAAAVILCALRLYAKYRQQIIKENEFLKLQGRLMLLHMEAVREQILRMEADQEMIAGQIEEIQKMGRGKDTDHRIEKYLQRLRESYRSLGAGTYSDDLMADAVIYHYSRIFSEMGIRPEISFRTYRKGCLRGEVTAEILINLLETAVTENRQVAPTERFLRLQGGIVKNQAVFRMECPIGKYRWKKPGTVSYTTLKNWARRQGGLSGIRRDNGCLQIWIVLEGEKNEMVGRTDRSAAV